mgnify:CR=1 FL=1
MPTKDDKPVTRRELRQELKQFATKRELGATKKVLEAAIAKCASREALNLVAARLAQCTLDIADIQARMATKGDIADLQARMATKGDIADLRRLIEPFLQKIVEHDERLGILEHKVGSLP